MCGRYSLAAATQNIMERFEVEQLTFDYQPRYNIAPGQQIPVIISREGKNRMGLLRWGLVPHWAKDESMAFKMINAKSETVHERPAFKHSFLRKRCIIPADGFYEWKQMEKGKQPMRIVRKDGGLFGMAGLYDTWTSPSGMKLHTVTILTRESNEFMHSIHPRMPVILRWQDEAEWLNRDLQEPELVKSLLRPYPDDELTAYPVASLVSNPRNETPNCIDPVI